MLFVGHSNTILAIAYCRHGLECIRGLRAIWIVEAAAWTRSIDMAAGTAALGVYTFVELGTYIHTGWECTTVGNVGAVALTFVQRYAGCDILQNAPQAGAGTNGIQIGPGTDLVTRTACTHPFTTYVTPTTLDTFLSARWQKV